jgi:type I restriction enzyme S subunit
MTLGLDDFKNVVVFLPPKSEQQKIASFLDQKTAKIDEIINKKETLIDHLEKYKKSVITEAVTKGKLRNKYIDEDGELVDQIEIKDSGIKIIGKISNFFDISKIKLKMKNITDGAHVSPDTENGVYDFISVTDLDKNKIDFENCLKTSKKSYRNLVRNGCKPVKNDVLLSKDGTIGETVIIEENHDFVIASSLIILRPKKEINSKFLNYFLKSNSYQNQLNMYSKGAALKRVSITNVSRTYIVFMDLEIQELIVKFLDEITTQIDILIQKTKESIEKYKEYKKSLIFEAVTGKIDLRDCELEGGEEFVEHNNSRETKRERLSAVD